MQELAAALQKNLSNSAAKDRIQKQIKAAEAALLVIDCWVFIRQRNKLFFVIQTYFISFENQQKQAEKFWGIKVAKTLV